MKKIILLFAIFAFATGFAQQESTPTVTVAGEGTVTIVPDKVVIRTRVEHSGQSATAIKKQNDSVVNQVIKYLKSEGISSKNIRTDYIRLNKEYNYNDKEYFYSANQALTITLEDLDRYEELMTGLLASGLNRIDGVEFQTSEEDQLKSEARKEAVLNARMKAKEYAEALGQKIGPAVNINESGNNGHQPVYRVMEMKSSDASSSETIAPGEMEVNVKVNVSFLLQ